MNSTEQFLIQMGLTYAQLRLSTVKTLTAEQKADLAAFIAAGQIVVADFAK